METLSDQKTNFAICRCQALTSTFLPCHKILHYVDDLFAQKMKPFFQLLSQINQGDYPDIPDDVEWNYYLKALCCNNKGYFQKGNEYCDLAIEQTKGKIYEFLAPLACLLQAQLRRYSNQFKESDDLLNSLQQMLEEQEANHLNTYFILQARCLKIFVQLYQINQPNTMEYFGELEDILSKFQPGDHLLILMMSIAKMEYSISMFNSHTLLFQKKKGQAVQDEETLEEIQGLEVAATKEKENAKEAAKICKKIIKKHFKPSHRLYAFYYQVKFKLHYTEKYCEKLFNKFPIETISNLFSILLLRLPLIHLRRMLSPEEQPRIQSMLERLLEKLSEYDAPLAKYFFIRELAIHQYIKRDTTDFMRLIQLSIKAIRNEPACFDYIKKGLPTGGFSEPISLYKPKSNESKNIPEAKNEEVHEASTSKQEESKEESKQHNQNSSQLEELSSGNTISHQDKRSNGVSQSQANLNKSSLRGFTQEEVKVDSKVEGSINNESQISFRPPKSIIRDSAEEIPSQMSADGGSGSQEKDEAKLSISDAGQNNESSNEQDRTILDIDNNLN